MGTNCLPPSFSLLKAPMFLSSPGMISELSEYWEIGGGEKKNHFFSPGKRLLFISKSAITGDTSVEIYECRKHFRSFISIVITIDGKAQWLDEDENKTQLPYDCQKTLFAFLRQHVNKFNLLQLIDLFYYN